MDLVTYTERTAETAVYPHEIAFLYCSIGLADEAGELLGVVKKEMRGDFKDKPDVLSERVRAELGDCFWYLSELSRHLGLDLPRLVDMYYSQLDDSRPLFLEVREFTRLAQSVLGTFHMSHYGNAYKDASKGVHKGTLSAAVGACVLPMVRMARSLEGGLGQVLQTNHMKLSGRKELGTLQGDGEGLRAEAV